MPGSKLAGALDSPLGEMPTVLRSLARRSAQNRRPMLAHAVLVGTPCSGVYLKSPTLKAGTQRLREAKPPPACERQKPVPGVHAALFPHAALQRKKSLPRPVSGPQSERWAGAEPRPGILSLAVCAPHRSASTGSTPVRKRCRPDSC